VDTADLSSARLLEPAAGDGAFVTPAAERLLASYRRRGLGLNVENLAPRILAFELLDREAAKARRSIVETLCRGGVIASEATTIAQRWVVTRDFLIHPPEGPFSHVVGNPPYCRWSRIPAALKAEYERCLPKDVAKGDIFLPFLDRSIAALADGGMLGFICSDRWKFMGFAEGFRARRLPQLSIVSDRPLSATAVFARDVDAYSSELVVRHQSRLPGPQQPLSPELPTLAEAGYEVRVGPALGCKDAFVISPGDVDIEPELLADWVDGRDVGDGKLRQAARKILTMHGSDGALIDLAQFPKAAAHLATFRATLEGRAIVRTSKMPWYTPIDRVLASAWQRPKLLVPELAKVPRVAIDYSGAIPSHGVYAVFAPDDDLDALAELWANGGLAQAISGRAPTVKGGYVRCYKRFLIALPAPPK
jgi:hypothetical protein